LKIVAKEAKILAAEHKRAEIFFKGTEICTLPFEILSDLSKQKDKI
jgi:hypothetical protein